MNDSLAASRAEAERLQIEIKKEQERVAIRSLVFARRMVLGTEAMVLKAWLEQQEQAMKRFSEHTLVSDLEGGLTGKTADNAKSYLRSITRPQLQSPIKV